MISLFQKNAIHSVIVNTLYSAGVPSLLKIELNRVFNVQKALFFTVQKQPTVQNCTAQNIATFNIEQYRERLHFINKQIHYLSIILIYLHLHQE